MDPNANVSQQREIARRIAQLIDRFAESDGSLPADAAQTVVDLADELAELVRSLDGWRRQDGFSPDERTIVDGDVTLCRWQGSDEGRDRRAVERRQVDAQVGYRIVDRDGRVESLYLNLSAGDRHGGPDGGRGNTVLVYHGRTGDPTQDGSRHVYRVFDPGDWPRPVRSSMVARAAGL